MEDIEKITDPVQVRERYVERWNVTMVDIWKEKIQKLGIVDTGALYNSVMYLPVTADGTFTELSIVHEFNMYGIYQDRGTGREKPKGNPGDIGLTTKSGKPRKFREERPWMYRKYVASMFNIRDFIADSIGTQFIGVIQQAVEVANGKAVSTYRGYDTV